MTKQKNKNNIAEIRKFRGFSQQRLADVVGVKRSTISSLEIGDNDLTASRARDIAIALNVSFNDIFDEKFNIKKIKQ